MLNPGNNPRLTIRHLWRKCIMTWHWWIIVGLVGLFMLSVVIGFILGTWIRRTRWRQESMNKFVAFMNEALNDDSNEGR